MLIKIGRKWATSPLSRDPHTVVMPDIGFIRATRLPGGLPASLVDGPPDLAIEIISPTDEPGQVRRKQRLYEQHEVPLVWWVDAVARTVTVHRLNHAPEVLDESSTLNGEDVLPGFQIAVSLIFTI